LQEVSYNDSNQPEREEYYDYDLNGLQTKNELVNLYYPDKIIYQASFKSGVLNNLLRHYYYGKWEDTGQAGSFFANDLGIFLNSPALP